MLLKVRRTRLERGLEQSAVAKAVGVNPAVLSRVERGVQVAWPSLRNRLAGFYNVSEKHLFEDVDAAQGYLRRAAGEQK